MVNKFTNLFKQIWWNSENSFPKSLGNKTDFLYKKKVEKETDAFLNNFVSHIQDFPENTSQQIIWKERLKNIIDNYVTTSDFISREDMNVLFQNGMVKSTEQFYNNVKNSDPEMVIEDIGQAMRNVWIMNIIQILMNKEIKCSPSVFGYSMLYPYTDNYLDDINILKEDKVNFNERFEKRLKGEAIEPISESENKIFSMVDLIESQFKREDFPEVYESLLGIHCAQKKSLFQQDSLCSPYEKDILGISIEKGGISVLTDAYLVNGKLEEKEAAFFFGYGVILQFCDDLQDAAKDLKNKHMTIFSQTARKWPLDNITNSMFHFMDSIIETGHIFKSGEDDEILRLIRKNCTQLILFAIVKNKSLFTKKYIKEIRGYLPFTFGYMKNFYKNNKKRYSSLDDSYGGMPVDKIILFGLE